MKAFDAALLNVERLAVDSAPIIYFIQESHRYLELVEAVFLRIDSGSMIGITTTITLTEVLTHTMRHRDRKLQESYSRLLLNAGHFTTLSIDARMAITAADLRARYTLRTPDALQVACALVSGCEAFLTNDKGIKRVNEIRVIVLDDLLEEHGSGSQPQR